MSDKNAESDNSGIDITLGKIAAYPVGVLLILSGIASLFSSVLGGVLITLSGIIALPYFRSKLKQSQNVSFSRWAVVGIVVLLVVAGGSTLDTGGSSLSGSVNDEVIDAEPESLYRITSSELEEGWSLNREVPRGDSGGLATYMLYPADDGDLVDGVVTIGINVHDTVEEAELTYLSQVEEQRDSGISRESVNFGNEGFLVKPSDNSTVITYRVSNIVVEVDASKIGDAEGTAEGTAENFAQDVEDNIIEAQE